MSWKTISAEALRNGHGDPDALRKASARYRTALAPTGRRGPRGHSRDLKVHDNPRGMGKLLQYALIGGGLYWAYNHWMKKTV